MSSSRKVTSITSPVHPDIQIEKQKTFDGVYKSVVNMILFCILPLFCLGERDQKAVVTVQQKGLTEIHSLRQSQ